MITVLGTLERREAITFQSMILDPVSSPAGSLQTFIERVLRERARMSWMEQILIPINLWVRRCPGSTRSSEKLPTTTRKEQAENRSHMKWRPFSRRTQTRPPDESLLSGAASLRSQKLRTTGLSSFLRRSLSSEDLPSVLGLKWPMSKSNNRAVICFALSRAPSSETERTTMRYPLRAYVRACVCVLREIRKKDWMETTRAWSMSVVPCHLCLEWIHNYHNYVGSIYRCRECAVYHVCIYIISLSAHLTKRIVCIYACGCVWRRKIVWGCGHVSTVNCRNLFWLVWFCVEC